MRAWKRKWSRMLWLLSLFEKKLFFFITRTRRLLGMKWGLHLDEDARTIPFLVENAVYKNEGLRHSFMF